jgi:hypothetical protein
MSPDFELLMRHLRERTGEVELDVPSPPGASEEAVAVRLARARQAAIRRGDRVAKLYTRVDSDLSKLDDRTGQVPSWRPASPRTSTVL